MSKQKMIRAVSAVVLILVFLAGVGAIAYLTSFTGAGYKFSLECNGEKVISDESVYMIDDEGVVFNVVYTFSPFATEKKNDFLVRVEWVNAVSYFVDGELGRLFEENGHQSRDMTDLFNIEVLEQDEPAFRLSGDVSFAAVLQRAYPGRMIDFGGRTEGLYEEAPFFKVIVTSYDEASSVSFFIRDLYESISIHNDPGIPVQSIDLDVLEYVF